MQALFYLKYRTFINSLKQLKEKPSKAIGAIAYLAFLFFVFMPDRSDGSGEEVIVEGLENVPILILSAGLLILMAIIATSTLHSSTNTGIKIFTKPDTHILFTSPLKPATILLFGMVGQLKAALLSSIFMLYQIPNLRRLGLTGKQIVLFFLVWVLSIFALQIYSTFAYAISFDSQKKKTIVLIFAYGIPLLVLLVFLIYYLATRSFFDALVGFLGSEYLYLIPIIGWSKAFLDLILMGFNPFAFFGVLLFALIPIVLLVVLYKIDFDYYEDALTMAQTNPTDQKDAEAVAEERARKTIGKLKVRDMGIKKGFGESTILFKQWREYRRTKPYIFGGLMIFQMIFIGIMAFAMLGDYTASGDIGYIYILWGFSTLFLYFSTFASKSLSAFSDPHFFILPGKSMLKVFYSTILSVILNLVDIIPVYLFVTFLFKLNPIYPLLGFVISASLLFAINAGQIITFRIFGDIKSIIGSMFLFVFTLISLIPTIVLTVFSYINLSSGNVVVWLVLMLAAVVLNLIFGVFGLFIGKGYLDKGPAV